MIPDPIKLTKDTVVIISVVTLTVAAAAAFTVLIKLGQQRRTLAVGLMRSH